MEDHRLKVYQNKVSRTHVDVRDMQKEQNAKNCIMQSCMICTLHHILLDHQTKENEMGIACCMQDSLEDPGNDQRIILKWILITVEEYRLDSCGSTTEGLL
jgi:hypothetical protein